MLKSENTKYEAEFNYAKGSLAVTPQTWHNFCWFCLRQKMFKEVNGLLVGRRNKVLIVGLGDGGILPQLKSTGKIDVLGVDINRDFLLKSKDYCDLVVASASHLPIKNNSIDMVFFELVLHHLKGQMDLHIPLNQALGALVPNGKVVAVEPNALNPSGVLLNLINIFHSYSRLFGGSDYEYALTSKELHKALASFSAEVNPLSFLHPRFPVFLQIWILRHHRFLVKWFSAFAWIFMAIGYKTKSRVS